MQLEQKMYQKQLRKTKNLFSSLVSPIIKEKADSSDDTMVTVLTTMTTRCLRRLPLT